MLQIYTRLLPKLFDKQQCTFNSHSLALLAEQVRGHGPLILHSAFVFESMLAHLKCLFHGTCGIPDQVCKGLGLAQHAHQHILENAKGNTEAE